LGGGLGGGLERSDSNSSPSLITNNPLLVALLLALSSLPLTHPVTLPGPPVVAYAGVLAHTFPVTTAVR